jgi:hypothetical protein
MRDRPNSIWRPAGLLNNLKTTAKRHILVLTWYRDSRRHLAFWRFPTSASSTYFDLGVNGLLLLLSILARHQWMIWVVSNRLDNTKSLGATLTEQEPVTWCKVLRALNEAERDSCAVSCANERSVNVDDGTRLGNRANVKHGLVLGFDGSGVRENKDWQR